MTQSKTIAPELELTLETLKDLTVTGREAQEVKGGVTTAKQVNYYCGSW